MLSADLLECCRQAGTKSVFWVRSCRRTRGGNLCQHRKARALMNIDVPPAGGSLIIRPNWPSTNGNAKRLNGLVPKTNRRRKRKKVTTVSGSAYRKDWSEQYGAQKQRQGQPEYKASVTPQEMRSRSQRAQAA